jgi:Sigma-70 region 2
MKGRVSQVPAFELAVRYLPLVEAAVARVSRQVETPVEWNRLIAIGAIALHDAANRHRSGRSVRFATHAKRCIRGAILDSLRRQISAPPRPRVRTVQNPVCSPGSAFSATEPGPEFSGTLVRLRKLLWDPRFIHEAS